jgi:hypothetical protein
MGEVGASDSMGGVDYGAGPESTSDLTAPEASSSASETSDAPGADTWGPTSETSMAPVDSFQSSTVDSLAAPPPLNNDAPPAYTPGPYDPLAVSNWSWAGVSFDAETTPAGQTDPLSAQAFPLQGPGSQSGTPLSRATSINGRLVESEQYDASGQLVARYNPPEAGRATLSLGDGYALVRDAEGAVRIASTSEAQAGGAEVIAGPGQRVVSGGERMFVLPANASPRLVAAAGSVAVAMG